MAKRSEQRARKLHPKSEALARRKRVQVTNSAETHAAIADGNEPGALARIMAAPLELTPQNTNAGKLADVSVALELLKRATEMASAARTSLILTGCGTTHPAAVYAEGMISNGVKATECTRQLSRAIGRTL